MKNKNKKLKMLATQILEQKLGFRPSWTDIILLESGQHSDEGKIIIDYIRFRRMGFERIEYSAHYAVFEYDLEIIDAITGDKLYI